MGELQPDPPIPSRHVTNDDLLEVSTELWGSTVYGDTAASLLESWRFDRMVWALQTFLPPGREQPYTYEEMAEISLNEWDAHHPPYEPILEHGFGRYVFARAGALSRLRLADFSRHLGYDTHQHHGTLGKTFDVLAVSSGVKQVKDVGAAHVETEFITVKELHNHLREVELPRYYRDELNTMLYSSIHNAVWKAGMPEWGEVVFEGFINTVDRQFEQVAVSSLHAFARSLPEDRPTARALFGLSI